MAGWQWLLWLVVPIGIVAVLFGLHRLCLWLEDRGLLYYRRKKPGSSPMGAFVAFQQLVEPGAKHVRHVSRECRDEDLEALRQRLLARLLGLLDSTPVDVEEVRRCLVDAKRAGLDWRQLYDEAGRTLSSTRPEHASLIPSADDVDPVQ